MFVEAIEKVQQFTRPIQTIIRLHDSKEITPSAATLFFVNNEGYAITCKHVAELLPQAEQVNARHLLLKNEIDALTRNGKFNRRKRDIESKYGIDKTCTTQIKNNFINCVDKLTNFEIHLHPTEDLAIIKFNGFTSVSYSDHAVFLRDSSKIKPGKSLCRIGYPFPEFSNFSYQPDSDDIIWTTDGRQNTPVFPIDGIMTRGMLNATGKLTAIELSTPGLKGQSGGPLFDSLGIIYGMQSQTHHLHLGFDIKEKEIRMNGKMEKVTNKPFLHLGKCIHVDIIKDFLREKGVTFYESEDTK